MKKLIALGLVLVMMLCACACFAEGGEETYKADLSGKKIGISFYAYASTSAIRQLDYLIYCIEQAGGEAPFAIANNSVEQHLADIETLLEQNIDALILDPCQMDGFENALAQCKEAGVPVFLMGNQLNPDVYSAGEDYVTLLQADFVYQGYQAGVMASQIANEKLNGKANAIVLFGTPGSASAIGRIEGVQAGVNDNSGVVLVGTQSAYNKAAEAQTITENYLMSSGGPDADTGVNLIINLTHNCAVGAVAGVKNMGYKLNDEVYVIVVDGVKEDLKDILDGNMYGAVESPTFYADQQVELISRYFEGETLEARYEIPPHNFTLENAQEWYDRFNEYDKLIGLEEK